MPPKRRSSYAACTLGGRDNGICWPEAKTRIFDDLPVQALAVDQGGTMWMRCFLTVASGQQQSRARRKCLSRKHSHWEHLEPRHMLTAPTIVADIATGHLSSSPTEFVEFNQHLYFAAHDASNARGIWRTDGTAGGTQRVAVIHPPLRYAAPETVSQLTASGGHLFFREQAKPGALVANTRLWRTDGTTAGTLLLRDFGTAGTLQKNIDHLSNVEGELFFTVSYHEWVGTQLRKTAEMWKSDGTPAGTVRLGSFGDISPGRQTDAPQTFVNVGRDVYFRAAASWNHLDYQRLVRWNSSSQSFVTLSPQLAHAGALNPSCLVVSNGQVMFASGNELWRTDGTLHGTVRVATVSTGWIDQVTVVGADVYVGVASGNVHDPRKVAVLRNNSFVEIYATTFNWSLTLRPWHADLLVVDRDSSGQAAVSRISTRTNAVTLLGVFREWGRGNGMGRPSHEDYFIHTNGLLYFPAAPKVSSIWASSETELWESDGTAAGTRVYDVLAGFASSPRYVTAFRGDVLYAASTNTLGQELWRFRPQQMPRVEISANTVGENKPAGTTVGRVTVGTAPAAIQLVRGLGDVDNNRFRVDGQDLKTTQAFNYEARHSYSIRVRIALPGGAVADRVIAIAVQDENERPTDLQLSNLSLQENLPAGYAVGILSARDPDRATSFTYDIVTGPGGEDNALFRVSRINTLAGPRDCLVSVVSFDHEAKSEYAVRLRVRDTGGLSLERSFIIKVEDAPDRPTAVQYVPLQRQTKAAVGEVVGTLKTTDQDQNDVHTYRLVVGAGSGDNSKFQIVGNELRAAVPLDLQVQQTYSVRVRSVDRFRLFVDAVVSVTWLPVPEPPVEKVPDPYGSWVDPADNLIRIIGANGSYIEIDRRTGKQNTSGTWKKIGLNTYETRTRNGWTIWFRMLEENRIEFRNRGPDGREYLPYTRVKATNP